MPNGRENEQNNTFGDQTCAKWIQSSESVVCQQKPRSAEDGGEECTPATADGARGARQTLTPADVTSRFSVRLSECKEILKYMTGKSLLIVGALALTSLGIASAKTYNIVFDAAAKAGTTELKPGEYKLKVEGSQAVFTNTKNAKSLSVPVKIQTSNKKFDDTLVESRNQGGMDAIQAIDLGGTHTRLTINQ